MTHELRKLAEAANYSAFVGDWPSKENLLAKGIPEIDAAYIAAANPKTVLELLDTIAELEGAEKRMAERACEVVDAYSDYDAQYCCDGRMCGCEGQTVHGMMKHFILAMVKP